MFLLAVSSSGEIPPSTLAANQSSQTVTKGPNSLVVSIVHIFQIGSLSAAFSLLDHYRPAVASRRRLMNGSKRLRCQLNRLSTRGRCFQRIDLCKPRPVRISANLLPSSTFFSASGQTINFSSFSMEDRITPPSPEGAVRRKVLPATDRIGGGLYEIFEAVTLEATVFRFYGRRQEELRAGGQPSVRNRPEWAKENILLVVATFSFFID
jgi:hypothetical protein